MPEEVKPIQTKEDLGIAINDALIAVHSTMITTSYLLEKLWPHIKAAQDAEWNEAIGEAIEKMKQWEYDCDIEIEDFIHDDFYNRLEELKQNPRVYSIGTLVPTKGT